MLLKQWETIGNLRGQHSTIPVTSLSDAVYLLLRLLPLSGEGFIN